MWARAEKWIVRWEVLLFILIGVAIFRIPNLFEPYWYGDEGIYLGVGQALNRGLVLYSQVHDNKPPLIYWIAAATDGSQFWYRLLFFIWMILTTAVFFRVAQRVEKRSAGIATLLFAIFTTWPTWEGNIANAELWFLLPILCGFWLVLTNKFEKFFLGGVMYGMAILFKVPAGFSLLVWPCVWILEKRSEWLKKCLALGIGVLIPIFFTFGISYMQKSIHEYTAAAWLQNIPYLSSWKTATATGIQSMKVRVVVLTLLISLWMGLANRWGKFATMLSIWVSWDLFAALLSTRPYPHYLLQMSVSLALLLGLAVKDVRARTGAVVMTILLVSVFFGYKFYSYRGAGYYANFVTWMVGQKTLSDYREWFDPQVVNNYKIAEVIKSKSNEDERIFVWGDQPMIYPLSQRGACGKYLAAYHIKDFSSEKITGEMLRDCKPRIIVDLGGFGGGLDDYMLVDTVGKAKVYRRLYNIY